MAPHSSTLAWKTPCTEEPGRLQSMGSRRVGHDWATSLSLSISFIGEGNGNPLQCSCLENPGMGEPGGLLSMGFHRVGHDWSDLAAAAYRCTIILINHSIIVELLDCTGLFITISNPRMNIFMHKDFSVNRFMSRSLSKSTNIFKFWYRWINYFPKDWNLALLVNNPLANAGDAGDLGLIPG